jgi:hypothetical protein
MDEEEGEVDPALLLLSDQLMDDEDDESEIYEMMEDEEDDEIIVGTPQPQYSDDVDSSFYDDADFMGGGVGGEDDDEGLVQENPFEPVYPASAGLLFETETQEPETTEKGIVLEAISLDNILPAGSRRRRQ